MMNKSILLVFAHPDDESFGVAGSSIHYSRMGVPVDLICATRGEVGTRVDVPEGISTGVAREAELRQAAAIMGVREIHFLDYIDGELEKTSRAEIGNKILEIMRKVRPGVVITFGPEGITRHPDHIAIGKAATRAFEKFTREDTSFMKLYYVTIPQSAIPDGYESDVTTRPDEEVTTNIDISRYFELKIDAIAAHRTQADAREFVKMLRQGQNASFMAVEFFYLASPRRTQKETDLFSEGT
jgi:N-acetylglucosamine malate deacetylase 2